MNAGRLTWLLGLVGLLGVVTFGSIWVVTGEVGAFAQVAGVLGAVALGTYAFVDRDRLAAGASMRELFAGASTALVLVLAAILGVFVVGLADEYDQTWDWTESGRYSLSPRAQSVMAGLEDDLEIYGIFQAGAPERAAVDRLGRLLEDASGRVTYEAIDPLSQPGRARAIVQTTGNLEMDRLSDRGTIVLLSGSRRRRVESRFDEEAIVNAVVKLNSGSDHRICWSVGHGERDADDDQSLHGYGITVLRLEDRNMVVTEQRILTGGVDRSCEALVIAGPTEDFLPRELEAIAAFVAEGGAVLLTLDAPGIEPVSTPKLVDDLVRYGIVVGMDVILENDPGHLVADPIAGEPLGVYTEADFKAHPILQQLPVGIAVRFPRSVQATDAQPGVEVREIVTSSQRSWAEQGFDPTATEPPEPSEGEPVGPVPFVVIAEVQDPGVLDVATVAPATDDTDTEGYQGPLVLTGVGDLVPTDLAPKPGGRVMVIGDADLGGNALTSLLDNGDFLLGAISFLVGEQDQIGADADDNETLTLDGVQFSLMALVGVLLVPGGAALAGIILLVRRRFL